MSIVGHPKITKHAYEQDRETIQAAVRFAESAVHNGLGNNHSLSHAQLLRLKAQIERDFLVAMLGPVTSQHRGIE